MRQKQLLAMGTISNPHSYWRNDCRPSAGLRSPAHANHDPDDSASRVDRNTDLITKFVRHTAGGEFHAD